MTKIFFLMLLALGWQFAPWDDGYSHFERAVISISLIAALIGLAILNKGRRHG
jgi:hypothetical protein